MILIESSSSAFLSPVGYVRLRVSMPSEAESNQPSLKHKQRLMTKRLGFEREGGE